MVEGEIAEQRDPIVEIVFEVVEPVHAVRLRLPGTLSDLLLLTALATVLYANSFGVPLILDNELLITQDPRIRAVRAENVSGILTQDYMAAGAKVSGVTRSIKPFIALPV